MCMLCDAYGGMWWCAYGGMWWCAQCDAVCPKAGSEN